MREGSSRTNSRYQHGFTIVEFLVVIAIIGILATIGSLSYSGILKSAARTVLQSDLLSAKAQLESDRWMYNSYPTSIAAANGGEGLPASDGTNLAYDRIGNSYCLTAWSVKAETSYYLDGSDGKVKEGACPDHIGYVDGSVELPPDPTDPGGDEEPTGPSLPSDQIAMLVASDGTENGGFGVSVDIDGDTAIVGSGGGVSGGSGAHIFTRTGSGWTQQQRLFPSGHGSDYMGNFGESVAISGDTAIVGASFTTYGYIFIYTRTGNSWTQQAQMKVSSNGFGASVDIDGDTAIVGAKGSYRIYFRTGSIWTQQASGSAADNNYASPVAIDGDTAIVGAKGSSRIYIRTGSSWSQQAALPIVGYVYSVAVDGDTAIVAEGAPHE